MRGKRVLTVVGVAVVGLITSGVQSASAATFTSSTPITIPAGAPGVTFGPATPFPSTLAVSGVNGTVARVTATVTGFSHTDPADVCMVLVAPGGQSLGLDCGSSGAVASNVSLTFDDQAGSYLPQTAALSTGTFKPTNYYPAPVAFAPGGPASYGNPGPTGAAPFATLASAFNGATANGTWQLFVQDFGGGDVGSIASWSLDVTGSVTGQRAAALKKCKKKHSHKARKKCKKRAMKLPV